MCLPVIAGASLLVNTLASTSIATGIIGGGIAALGKYREGKISSQVNRNNAIISDRLATDAVKRGKVREERFRGEVEQLKGAQIAGFAKSGVDVSEGSALDVRLETAEFGELDALTIRANAEREAFGYKTEARGFRTQGKADLAAGKLGATATILGTAGDVASKWYSFRPPIAA